MSLQDKENVTLIGFALDKSGSMGSKPGLWQAALSGTNEFVQSQDPAINTTLPPNKTLFGMVLFDIIVTWRTESSVFNRDYLAMPDAVEEMPEPPYVVNDIKDFIQLSADKYRPYGMTALYDAVATLINGMDLYIIDHPEQQVNVILVIQTDGEENSSTKTSANDLRALITERTSAGWKFTFLGADQNACLAADRIGIDRSASLSYSNDPMHTRKVMYTMSKAVSRHRTLPVNEQSQAQVSYTNDERQELGAHGWGAEAPSLRP